MVEQYGISVPLDGQYGSLYFDVPEENIIKGKDLEKYAHLAYGYYDHGKFMLVRAVEYTILIPKNQKGTIRVPDKEVNVIDTVFKRITIKKM